MQDLALQVRWLHHVGVEQAERADPGRGQVQRRRTAQAAQSYDQDTCLPKPALGRPPPMPGTSRLRAYRARWSGVRATELAPRSRAHCTKERGRSLNDTLKMVRERGRILGQAA